MTDMKPLLIEIGTEELPVKALPGLAQAFSDGVIDGLVKRGVAIERGDAKPLYTPRRLAVLLPGVAADQPEQHAEVLGPYANIALDAAGQPTRALQGFAAKAGVEWTALERMADNKGERFVHRATTPGAKTFDLLQDILREAVAAMPIPKPMRWGDHDHAFARPVHWLVLLHGDAIVEADLFGVRSDRMSRGHRFMHDKPLWIGGGDVYVDALRGAHVLVDPDERRARIVREVEAAAEQAGGVARIDPGNLEQVNCLVEWPSAVLCDFDRAFLDVPAEALVATMETHQKFFPVLDGDGNLTEHFIGIANIASTDVAEVRKGYERVIRPRFADARFFFEEDLKTPLAQYSKQLELVVYHPKLGSLWQKTERMTVLAKNIAHSIGIDVADAIFAAQLSKCDLMTRMVGEFPELQGIIGRHYALITNCGTEVSDALAETYMPRFSGDGIAPSLLGQVIAVSDRIDTLATGFYAGLRPTGNKDAFGLRRTAIGLARTLIEGSIESPGVLEFNVRSALAHSIVMLNKQHSSETNPEFQRMFKDPDDLNELFDAMQTRSRADTWDDSSTASLVAEIYDFMTDRLRGYYGDQNVTPQQFESVATLRPASLLDFDRRLKAIGEFAKLPEAEALAAANKRIRNILKKAEGDIPSAVDPGLFAEDAERNLSAAIDAAVKDTDPLLAQRDYVAVLARLARLRPQVDAFFDQVMVNADAPAIRGNRLALLQRLSDRLGSVAAIEHLSN